MRYEIVYTCLWGRYTIVHDTKTNTYNRYDIVRGKHVLTRSSADVDTLYTLERRAS